MKLLKFLWNIFSFVLKCFYVGHFLVLIELVTISFLLLHWCFDHEPHGILTPRPGVESTSPCIGRQSVNHWTAREVPWNIFSFKLFILRQCLIHRRLQEIVLRDSFTFFISFPPVVTSQKTIYNITIRRLTLIHSPDLIQISPVLHVPLCVCVCVCVCVCARARTHMCAYFFLYSFITHADSGEHVKYVFKQFLLLVFLLGFTFECIHVHIP